tara:strand:+ start:2701 stop:3954 length:1254 start_codon:yes stop_codon:yes gene_type:complete
METISTFVFSVGLIIFAAHFFTALFERTRVPDVLPLIGIGILVGPLLGILSPSDFGYVGPLLSAIALTLMLFEGGSHLTLETLKTSLKDSVVLALSTFILTVFISCSFAYFVMGNEIIPSLFIGAVLGSISPAVVVPIVRMLNFSENSKSTLVVESAITDVLSIILALGILKTFQSGHNSIMEFIGIKLIASMAMSLLLGFGGAIIWSTILEKIRKFPNTIFTSLAFIFLLYGSAEILGYSGPVSVLIFGIVLANSKKIPLDILQRFGTDHLIEFTSIEKTLFSEVIFLVKTFFFIFLGMSIQFGNGKILLIGIILTGLIYIGRLFLCKLLIKRNTPLSEVAMISFIIPKGLAAAVLAEVPMHMGLPTEIETIFIEIRAIIYIVILFSILLTAFLIYGYESGLTQSRYDQLFKKTDR